MSKLSPMDLMNKIRNSANLEDNNFSKQIAIKLNKEGKIKFQLLALDSDHLFIPRTQHFIPKVPNSDDTKEKIIVCDCLGENCPICSSALAFRNSGVELDDVNEIYHPKYPYQNLRSVFTQPEHFLLGAKILLDSPEEGTYLPKDSQIGSTQLIQFSRSALNSLMQAYEDFIDDHEEEDLPPLFGIFEEGEDTVKSLTVSCRIQTSPYSYNFTFGKSTETNIKDVDKEKLQLLSKLNAPANEYVEKAVKRVKDITNFFTGITNINNIDDNDVPFSMEGDISEDSTNNNKFNSDEDDFDLDDIEL